MTRRLTPAAAGTGLDATVERLGRWTAGRTTRRSFLNRLGQLAVFVATGPTIAGLLVREAQARVCGQSGVTPKCDTFDCVGPGDVWGWCWYASDGCCANGGLKKICDCCTVDYPNVHGYCPSGTNVRCIVESCGTDPRVLNVALTPITWAAGVGYHHAAIGIGHTSAIRAVVASDDDRWMQYVAAPLAGALGSPLLGIATGGPTAADLALLASLNVQEVLQVGPVDGTATFTANSITVDTVSSSSDLATVSLAVADHIAKVNDINRTVTVEQSGLSADVAPAAAAFAALGGFPLMVGAGAAKTLGWPTVYVGPEPVDQGLVHDRTTATTLVELSMELADWAAAIPGVSPERIALAPVGTSDVIGLINLHVPLVLHPTSGLGPLQWWIQDHSVDYGLLEEIYHVQGPGQLTSEQYWHLQSAANGFRVDQLQGVAGEGLPVIRQPVAERPLGLARIDGALDFGGQPPPSYWTSQGQTLRR
ncbi:MAG: hypothetical protein AAF962_06130 [Actinomycetota bacterium]